MANPTPNRRPSAVDQQVYVIGPKTGPRKIGVSNNPSSRLVILKYHYKVNLYLHYVHPRIFNEACEIEKLTHDLLRDVQIEGEWFDISTEKAIEAISAATNAYDRGERFLSKHLCPIRASRTVGVACSPSFLRTLDDWRASQSGGDSHRIPSRAAALRQLAEIGLSVNPPACRKMGSPQVRTNA